ncbi:MAG: retropepsin-like aspartic protease [Beijerinckiaceae bacterium]|nr:retropepsin-like aspartic protease [Beijerinckiaceae bacterium]
MGQWVFTEMAEAYAADHRYCEAIGPLELYVSLDPATRDVPKIKKLIEDYSKQGKCTDFAKGGDSFPIVGTGLIPVRVSINGVMGNFLLDTGASFVTVTSGFAQRAGLSTTNSTITRSMTANGAVFDKIATARMITVGHARAHDVPVLVQDRPLDGQDGLLGRSFLTRFDVKISASRWELTQKK